MSLILKQETQRLLSCRSKVYYSKLSQYLLKPLLIHTPPTFLYNAFFSRPTMFSNCPPNQDTLLKLSFHLISLMFKKWCKIFGSLILLIHLETARNVFALLEYIVSGHQRLAINLFNALMNSSLLWSGNNSKCIALVKLQVKRRMYDFFSLLFLAWYMIG